MVQIAGKKEVKKFCADTSAHGLPRVAAAPDRRTRWAWGILLLICVCSLIYHIVMVIQKFQRYEKIVSVEIIFEAAEFPGVTLCNLNPYKNTLANEVDEIKKTLKAFNKAMTVANPDLKNPHSISRMKRDSHSAASSNNISPLPSPNRWLVHPILSSCTCSENSGSSCSPNGQDEPISMDFTCLCVRDSTNDKLWPCSPIGQWIQMDCSHCSSMGYCAHPIGMNKHGDIPCLCSKILQFCVAMDKPLDIDELPKTWKDSTPSKLRVKRQATQLQPALVTCKCSSNTQSCSPAGDVFKKPGTNETTCLCFYNANSEEKVLWPCYEEHNWKRRDCIRCSIVGTCDYVADDPEAGSGEEPSEMGSKDGTIPCLCVSQIHICVKVELDYKEVSKSAQQTMGNVTKEPKVIEDPKIVKFWEITTPPPAKEELEFEKAQGFGNMTDSVAITTKAKENLLFAVSKMDAGAKSALGYTTAEFITKCSFNGRQCEAEKDFKLYIDPHYGNCYIFNASLTGNARCEQSGPHNGLRVELVVDVSDYLPTTEASGVRLAVHPLTEQPFPDTSGYSAPTGFISSFGIRMKRMNRLPAPYGDCVMEGKTEDYIYNNSEYTPEGCQRTCLQRYLVHECSCGDPKYPNLPNTTNCPAADPVKRDCLKSAMAKVTSDSGKVNIQCHCKQPCSQVMFSTSYSAAKWPAGPHQVSDCPQNMMGMECVNYFRENKAMVEVFFEELAYEYLIESEAYGFPNLLADFGGQLGLWMGVSVITCMELAVFIWEMLNMCCCHRSKKPDEKTNSDSTILVCTAVADNDGPLMNGDYVIRKRPPDYFEAPTCRLDGNKKRISYRIQSDFL